MIKLFSKGTVVSLAVVLSACSNAKAPFERPEASVPVQFTSGNSDMAQPNPVWWQGLNDPLLNAFVTEGLSQNLTLQAARMRLAASEEALLRTGPRSRLDGSGTVASQLSRTSGAGGSNRTDTIQLGARYVFDLFGRGARETERATALRDIAAFDEAQTRLAFQAQIVSSYLEARHQIASKISLEESLNGRRNTLYLVRQQLEAGVVTALDVARAQAQIDAIEASIPERRAAYQAAVFSIATLLSVPANDVIQRLEASAGHPSPRGGLDVGVPAQLIRARPDVRLAEAELRAATAAAGIAEADLYPSLSLNGTISIEPTDTISFGPTLNIPVFNLGILRSRQREAAIRAQAAELAWRQSILVAIEEVQSNLANVSAWRARSSALNDAERNLRHVVSLSRQTLGAGETTALQLLDAQQDLNRNQLDQLSARNAWARSWVRLQIALGHGWVPIGE